MYSEIELNTPTAPESLRAKIVRGSIWNMAGTMMAQAVKIVSMIVIARLLTPADFAIAGISTAATQMIILFGGFGFGEALIAKKEITKESCHTVFWATAAIKLVLGLIICLLAGTLADFCQNQLLVKPIIFIGIGFIFSIGNVVPANLLYREMRFWELNVVNFIATVISVIIAVILATKGFGYWSIIFPTVVITPLRTIMQSIVAKYSPRLRFSWQELRQMANFGFFVLGTKVARFFAENGDYLILGRFLPTALFGQYYFAYEKARLTIDSIAPQLEGTLFPAFSKMQDNVARLRDKCLEATQMITWFTYPLSIILILLAKPLVPIVFGEQWRAAIVVFQFFCAYAFTYYLWGSAQMTLYSLNKPQSIFYFEIIKMFLLLPLLFCAGISGITIEQIALFMLITTSILNVGMTVYIYRLLGTTWIHFGRYFYSLCAACGVLAVVGLVVIHRLDGLRFIYTIYNLIGLCLAGLLIYVITLMIVQKGFWQKINLVFRSIK